MPKIIENLKSQILEEAKKQVLEIGYEGMTLRSVAKGCGIAVGTIYNYYPSKDMLVAAFVLEDWHALETSLREACAEAVSGIQACRSIYTGLLQLESDYSRLFEQDAARKTASVIFPKQHRKLRGQLAELLRIPCLRFAKCPTPFLPEFLAEALLAWSSEKADFANLETVIRSLFE